jgi:hypothetical protein
VLLSLSVMLPLKGGSVVAEMVVHEAVAVTSV